MVYLRGNRRQEAEKIQAVSWENPVEPEEEEILEERKSATPIRIRIRIPGRRGCDGPSSVEILGAIDPEIEKEDFI